MALSTYQEKLFAQWQEKGQKPTHMGGRKISVRTWEALERMGYLEDGKMTDAVSDLANIAENLYDHRPLKFDRLDISWYNTWQATFDAGHPDYRFWDKAFNGNAKGLEISGLFFRPLVRKKVAWVFGQTPTIQMQNPDAQELINQWWQQNHSALLQVMFHAGKYGDGYAVLNADETVSSVPPHVMRPIVDETNFADVIGWQVRQVFEHPIDRYKRMTLDDRYYSDVRIQRKSFNQKDAEIQRFPNLVQMLPVIHWKNNDDGNSMFGHPEGTAVVNLFQAYGKVIADAMAGHHLLGKSTPLFKFDSDDAMNTFINAVGEDYIYYDNEGTRKTRKQINFRAGEAVVGLDFDFVSPKLFTTDTLNLLNVLFWILTEYSEYPEIIWGVSLGQGLSKGESMLDSFVRWVDMERSKIRETVIDITRIAIAYLNVLYPRQIAMDEQFSIQWQPITDKDGKLTLDALEVAMRYGALDMSIPRERQALYDHLPVDFSDEEKTEMLDEMVQRVDAEQRRQAGQDEPFIPDPDADDDDTEPQGEARRFFAGVDLDESQKGNAGYVTIDLEGNADVNRYRQLVADALGSAVVDTSPAHITLCYLPDIADADFVSGQIADMDAFKVRVSGISLFNNRDSRALHLIVDHTPQLDRLQNRVYYGFRAGIERSPFSVPERWQPHITLAYLPQGVDMPDIPFEPFEIEIQRVIYARDNYQMVASVMAQEPVLT